MGEKIIVPKIGDGSEFPFDKPLNELNDSEGPFRPKTNASIWIVREDRRDEFLIEVFD
ncbi:hypothetical protein [Paenibacillus sp. FSL H7-0326]|uniref:hypothetical protein n=1 Tax=Paenibacillus sp. FSL H7-0326 TaxID=1921144 RepID=UPI0015C3C5C8|nr:hypothetical protein [Paenibacillus sp. FSL H7-0326]